MIRKWAGLALIQQFTCRQLQDIAQVSRQRASSWLTGTLPAASCWRAIVEAAGEGGRRDVWSAARDKEADHRTPRGGGRKIDPKVQRRIIAEASAKLAKVEG